MNSRTEAALNFLALVLSLLGGMTLVAFPVGLIRGAQEGTSIVLVMICVAYGILALATGVLLYRRSELAPRFFLMWCVLLVAFVAGVPEMRIPLAIPGTVLGLVLLFWIYRYIARYLGSRPRVGGHGEASIGRP